MQLQDFVAQMEEQGLGLFGRDYILYGFHRVLIDDIMIGEPYYLGSCSKDHSMDIEYPKLGDITVEYVRFFNDHITLYSAGHEQKVLPYHEFWDSLENTSQSDLAYSL